VDVPVGLFSSRGFRETRSEAEPQTGEGKEEDGEGSESIGLLLFLSPRRFDEVKALNLPRGSLLWNAGSSPGCLKNLTC
jgi:hypothetical protein